MTGPVIDPFVNDPKPPGSPLVVPLIGTVDLSMPRVGDHVEISVCYFGELIEQHDFGLLIV